MTDFNRNDLKAGFIPAIELSNGVTIPPSLRVNALTFAEHQEWNIFLGKKPLTGIEAAMVGHREDEVLAFFAEPVTASSATSPEPVLQPPSLAIGAIGFLASVAPPSAQRAAARDMGYTGDQCDTCGNFAMVRNGTCLKCTACGSTTGCS